MNNNKNNLSRRKFVLGGATAATIAAGSCLCTKTGRATITGIGTTPELEQGSYTLTNNKVLINLAKTAQLNTDGKAVKLKDNNLKEPLIIARINENVYIATSLKCTHRGVELEYKPDEECFKCASLGSSKFSTDGKKIKGFAKRDLFSYPTKKEKDLLTIKVS